jgi:hypothetical protein
LTLEARLLLLEGCKSPAARAGVFSEPARSEPGAGTSPPKAPLQIVIEKNSSPKNRRRIVGCTSCISSSASRDFGRKYGMLHSDPIATQWAAIEHAKQHEEQSVVLWKSYEFSLNGSRHGDRIGFQA